MRTHLAACLTLVAVLAVFIYPLMNLPHGFLKERIQVAPVLLAMVVSPLFLLILRSLLTLFSPDELRVARAHGAAVQDLICTRTC